MTALVGYDEHLAKSVEDAQEDGWDDWKRARLHSENLRIRMDVARGKEHELAIKWISGGCKLHTYQKARDDFQLACDLYLEACDYETRIYDALTDFQQEDGADHDAASDDEAHRLSQS